MLFQDFCLRRIKTHNEGNNNNSNRTTWIKRLAPFIVVLLVALSACNGSTDDAMGKTYYYCDNRDIVLSIDENQYYFSGSGEEFEWIISQFGQTGSWELDRVENIEDAEIYDNQGRFYVRYKENNILIGRELYISYWLEFIE